MWAGRATGHVRGTIGALSGCQHERAPSHSPTRCSTRVPVARAGVSTDDTFREMKDVQTVTSAATDELTKLLEKKRLDIENAA